MFTLTDHFAYTSLVGYETQLSDAYLHLTSSYTALIKPDRSYYHLSASLTEFTRACRHARELSGKPLEKSVVDNQNLFVKAKREAVKISAEALFGLVGEVSHEIALLERRLKQPQPVAGYHEELSIADILLILEGKTAHKVVENRLANANSQDGKPLLSYVLKYERPGGVLMNVFYQTTHVLDYSGKAALAAEIAASPVARLGGTPRYADNNDYIRSDAQPV